MTNTPAKHGFWSTLLNLFTCMCGLGVLAWPHNVGGSGVVLSAVALGTVLAAFLVSVSILAQVAEQSPTKTIQAMVEAYFGRQCAVAMQIIYMALGATVVMNALVVVADSFGAVKYAEDLDRGYILLIACGLLFFIALPKKLNSLGVVSFFSLIALVTIYVTIAIDASDGDNVGVNRSGSKNDAQTEVPLLPSSTTASIAIFPVFVSSFTVHVNAIRAIGELDDMRCFPRVVLCLAAAATIFYAMFTITALYAYGADVPGDVQDKLSGTKGTVARLTTGILQLLKTPFIVQPCRDMGFDVLQAEETAPRRIVATALVCAVVFGAAYPVRDLSKALSILGGLAGATCTLGLPGALGVAHARRMEERAWEGSARGAAEEGRPLVPAHDATYSFSPRALRPAGFALAVAGPAFLVLSLVSLGVG